MDEYPENGQYNKVQEIIEFTKTRDVVILNQRGNANAPGLYSRERVVFGEPGKLEMSHPFATRRKNLKQGYQESAAK